MNELELSSNARKEVFDEVEKYLAGLNLTIVSSDFQRPWGGFFVIDEMQAKQFAHHRRAEIWRTLSGTVGVVTSFTDEESDTVTLTPGQEIRLAQGQRHRLKGLTEWGVLAEIWQHTNAQHPSDENDIVRVQDDFGR